MLALLFLLANEHLSHFLLAIWVGDLSFADAYQHTFRYTTVNSYIFSAAFRAIPYVALALLAVNPKVSTTRVGRVAMWFTAFLLAAYLLLGYWNMQHSLFTPEHTSSTASLALIWLPIWALLFGGIGYTLLFVVIKIFSWRRT